MRDKRIEDVEGQLNIGLLDYFSLIARNKKMVISLVVCATVISIIYSLMLPKMYRSDAKILPIGGDGGGGLASLASSLSASVLGSAVQLGGASSNNRLLVLLKSRTMAEKVAGLSKLDLKRSFFWNDEKKEWKDGEEPTLDMVAQELMKSVSFSQDFQTKLITVTAETISPKLAADIANIYPEELQVVVNEKSFTAAKRNRIFIEKQLAQNKKDLFNIGKEINEFYKTERVSNVESKVNVVLSPGNEFDFSRKEETHLDELESQKLFFEKKLNEMELVKDVPQQVYLQYLTLRRELLGQINALLSQQYEMAKIEESKKNLAFQVIDPAIPPLIRFKPERKKIVIMAIIGSFVFSFFLIFLKEWIETIIGSKITLSNLKKFLDGLDGRGKDRNLVEESSSLPENSKA